MANSDKRLTAVEVKVAEAVIKVDTVMKRQTEIADTVVSIDNKVDELLRDKAEMRGIEKGRKKALEDAEIEENKQLNKKIRYTSGIAAGIMFAVTKAIELFLTKH